MYNKILELAKKRGVTFAEISRATGISEPTFSNLKARGGSLTIETLTKIADYFGVSLDYFRDV